MKNRRRGAGPSGGLSFPVMKKQASFYQIFSFLFLLQLRTKKRGIKWRVFWPFLPPRRCSHLDRNPPKPPTTNSSSTANPAAAAATTAALIRRCLLPSRRRNPSA